MLGVHVYEEIRLQLVIGQCSTVGIVLYLACQSVTATASVPTAKQTVVHFSCASLKFVSWRDASANLTPAKQLLAPTNAPLGRAMPRLEWRNRVAALHLARADKGQQHRHASCASYKEIRLQLLIEQWQLHCWYSLVSGMSKCDRAVTASGATAKQIWMHFSLVSLIYVSRRDAIANLTPAKQLFVSLPIGLCLVLPIASD